MPSDIAKCVLCNEEQDLQFVGIKNEKGDLVGMFFVCGEHIMVMSNSNQILMDVGELGRL